MARNVFEEGKKQGEVYAVEIAMTAANKSPGITQGSRNADPEFLLGFYEGIIATLKTFIERHKGAHKDEVEAEDA
jgi:hypothetical protein